MSELTFCDWRAASIRNWNNRSERGDLQKKTRTVVNGNPQIRKRIADIKFEIEMANIDREF